MKPGDYLIIEFGHNDMKQTGPNAGAYKQFKTNLEMFIQAARDKGGIPVLVTPMHRRGQWQNGKVMNSFGDYPDAVRLVAREQKVALLELNNTSAILYEAMGEEGSKKAFVHYPANTFPDQPAALADNTHFNPYGGYQLAKCIIELMKGQQLKPILKYLRKDYPGYDPAHPDPFEQWNWPASTFYDLAKPEGN